MTTSNRQGTSQRAHIEPEASAYLVAGYAAAVSSSEPAPGGGSVAGVVGALAASLAEMVGHLSTGRGGDQPEEARLVANLESASALRSRFLELAAADEAAYGGYVAATKLPKGTDAEKATRRASVQAALGNAADMPLTIAANCRELLDVLEHLANHGNKHVLSDVVVAAMCAEVATRASCLNVLVNARMIKDEERSRSYEETAHSLEQLIQEQSEAVIAAAKARM